MNAGIYQTIYLVDKGKQYKDQRKLTVMIEMKTSLIIHS